MSVNAVNGTDNRGRNAAIGAGVGLVGGGAAGYFTKSILKDGNFSDEFIHKTMLATAADDSARDNLKLSKKITEMGDDASVGKMKKVLNDVMEKSKKFVAEDQIEATKKAIAEGSDDEVKSIFNGVKTAAETIYDEGKKVVSDTLETVYDKAGKKFKELPQDAAEETKKFFEAAKKTARNMKIKPAAIYGVAAAVVAGLIGYAATPKAKPAEGEASAEKANS